MCRRERRSEHGMAMDEDMHHMHHILHESKREQENTVYDLFTATVASDFVIMSRQSK